MANPTTNYGFVLPTPTDLVTDLPADFDVALQGVDTRLKALQPGTTLGDLAYSSATANTNTRLGVGSTGQVLTVTGGVPVWAAPAAGGKVLQVVQGTLTSIFTTSSATFVDSGLTVTITPSSATSKVMVMVSIPQAYTSRTGAGGNNFASTNLVRGATTLQVMTIGTYQYASSSNQSLFSPITSSYLDSPATTSATTYKVQAQIDLATSISLDARATYIASIVAMEIGA